MSIWIEVTPWRVHVAQVVLGAENIGQHGDAAAFLDEAHRDAGARRGHRHPGIKQCQRPAAHRGHRGRAIRLEDIGHDADRVGELLVGREQRLQCPLGERAVPDLPPRRAADGLHFAGRKRREVVVQHERLRGLLRHIDRVDPLLVRRGPERRGDERLGLAAREQRRAVRAGEDAHLARDRSNGIEIAAVDPLAARQHLLAHRAVFDVLDHVPDVLRVLGELGGQLLLDRRLERGECLRPLRLLRQIQRLRDARLREGLHPGHQVRRRLDLGPLHLRLARLGHQLIRRVE
jgi:hypothetical protein